MYLDLVINNKAKQMYFGYMSGVKTSSLDESSLELSSTPKIEKLGTSFRQLLGNDRPNTIYYAQDNTVFMRINNLATDLYNYTNCTTLIDNFQYKGSSPYNLPIVNGKKLLGEITTFRTKYRYVSDSESRLSFAVDNRTIYPSYTDYRLDFMFFATDEIKDGKRTIIVLYPNKFDTIQPVYSYGGYSSDSSRQTHNSFLNMAISGLNISYESNPQLYRLDLGYRINNHIYPLTPGTINIITPGKSFDTCNVNGCILAYYDYSFLSIGNQTKFITPTFNIMSDRIDIRGFYNPKINYNNISDYDNPEPPYTPIPDLPIPDPEDPTDPDNPDNPDNLEPEPSDPIPRPKPNQPLSFSAKLLTLYRLSIDNLNSLANEMWTDDFTNNIARLFTNPMDCLISLSEYPIQVPAGEQKPIKLGNVELSTSASIVRNAIITIDLGSCMLSEKYNSYLDYMNTKVEIYLPFIGLQQLSIDYMNSLLNLSYNVDLLSGNCVAILYANSLNSNLQSVVGQWNGNMAYSIPLSGRDFSQMASSLWNTAMSAGSVIASSRIPAVGASGFSKGSAGGFGLPSLGSVSDLGNNIINTIEAANATTSGGHLSANAGHLGSLQPYLIISRPVQKINANYYNSYGRILDAYTPFSALSGYTKVKSVNLTIPSATEEEIKMIEDLLLKGVIF